MFRRQYLVSVTPAVASLSGCLSSITPDGKSPTEPNLEAVGVGNLHSKSHTVHLRVRRNDEAVLERKVTLDSYSAQSDADEVMFRSELPDEPGRYAVSARLEGHEERTADVTNGDVCRVDVLVQKDGGLGIASRRDCESP